MLIRLLRRYLLNYRRPLAIVVVLQGSQALLTLYLPNLNASLIDKGVIAGNNGYIWHTGGQMLVVTLVQVVCATGAVYFGSKAAMGFGRDVRDGLFDAVTGFSAQEVAAYGAPSLITRITNDVQQVQMFVLMTCTLLIAAPITAVGGVVLALRQDVGLSWILTVSVPLLVLGVGVVLWRMVPPLRLAQERIDGVNRVLREQLTGMRVVRAFVHEDAERERFAKVNDQLTSTALRAGRIQAWMFPIVMIVLNASTVAVVWLGGHRIDSGHLKVGAMIAFLTYLTQILLAAMMATFVAVLAPRASVSAERIIDVVETPSSVITPSDPTTDIHTRGSFELRGVGFHYPGAEAPVLTNVTLRAGAGQTTAIIGSTGSGKTTLVNLIPRLFDATSGTVLVDDVDVRRLDPETLWRRIGLVPQKPYLFSGTVATNLRFADAEATDEELWAALAAAQATDFVSAMPGGLDAPVLQGGSNVSGGQRQRLAIARAFVRRPEIYLFDDVFSALDLVTDALLRSAMVRYTAEATVVIVAQRVSTIMHADQIVVLEDGNVVGHGTHTDLMTSSPTYQEIVASQATMEAVA